MSSLHPMALALKRSFHNLREHAENRAVVTALVTLPVHAQSLFHRILPFWLILTKKRFFSKHQKNHQEKYLFFLARCAQSFAQDPCILNDLQMQDFNAQWPIPSYFLFGRLFPARAYYFTAISKKTLILAQI